MKDGRRLDDDDDDTLPVNDGNGDGNGLRSGKACDAEECHL